MSDLQMRLKDLPPEKLRLLARRLKKRDDEPALPVLDPAPQERHEPFPLTDVQQSLWVGRRDLFDLGNVSTHGYWEMPMVDLDIDRLTLVLRRLIDRHEMLRAIVLNDGRQQVLQQVPPYEVRTIDLRGRPPAEAQEALAAVRSELSHQVLPADCWPVFDIRASLLDGRKALVHVSFDFLIGDLWSFRLLLSEMRQLYADPTADLAPIDLSFRDYVLALKQFEGTDTYRRSEAYWRERLPAIPPGPELPVSRTLRTLDKPVFRRRPGVLDPERWRRLRGAAARRGLTPSGLLLTAYSVILALWSRTPRFTVNITNFNRLPIHPHIKNVIGDFASLTLLPVDFSQPEPFESRARRVQGELWSNLQHGHLSAVRLMRDLARLEGRAPSALLPVVFTSLLIEDRARDEDEPRQAPAGMAEEAADPAPGVRSYGISQTPQIWLDHQVAEERGSLFFNWDAVEDLFPPGVLDEMFAAYNRLLNRLLAEESWTEPDAAWLLADQLAERARLNATDEPHPPGCLHTLFEEQAARCGDRPAIIASDRELTYRELDREAEQWAGRLRRQGAWPGRLVAVVMEKGWEQVVAVLAVLKAGAAYLPIDPGLPRDLWCHLLAHGQAEIILTQPRLDRELDWPAGIVRWVVRDGGGDPETPPAPEWAATPRDLAYVLYTSGTTGLPKGAMIEHGSAVNRIVDSIRRFEVGADDRVLALTALHHDMSVFDLFGALAAGAAVIVPDAASVRDPAHWAELMTRHRVTIWNSVPAFLEMLVDYLEHRPDPSVIAFPSLRLAFLGGDWIHLTLSGRLRAFAPSAQPFSVGGPTEATLWDICHPIGPLAADWPSVPYGRPMANTRYHVLNEALEPCPDWVPGELCITGAGIARGYWRDPERTAAAFVPHPRTGERMYRSGDVGRYRPGGVIEFLGREDLQVKIRGQRIELGGIERTLEQHPKVRSAVVAAVGAESAQRRLVAYVVPDDRSGVLTGKLDQLRFKMSEPGLRQDLDGRERTGLPRPVQTQELLDIYRARASRRQFQETVMPGDRFGDLLSTLSAIEVDGSVQLYVHVKPGRVEGIPGGLYAYHPGEHALLVLEEGVELGTEIHVEVNRAAAGQSAFTLFLVGRLRALEPAHGEQALRLALLEAGAIGQLLMESAPAGGLGLCPVGTLDFAQVAPFLPLEEGDRLLHSFLGGLLPEGRLAVAESAPEAIGALDLPAASREGAPRPSQVRSLWQRSEPGLRRGDGDRRLSLPAPARAPALLESGGRGCDPCELLPETLSPERVGWLLGALRGIRSQEWLLPKYRYPSAGGLYPVQVYLHVREGGAEGLAGTYYYHPRSHRLALLSPAAWEEASASLTLFLVGQLDAIRPRYGALSLEFCLLEAGYMSQLLRAVGPQCGIGLCPVESLDFPRIAPRLDLGPGHVLLHTLMAGAVPWAGTAAGLAVEPGEPEIELPRVAARWPGAEDGRLVDELKSYLRGKLPQHMVPSAFLLLDAWPLTPNGKVDRRALPQLPDRGASADREVPPRTELERQLAALIAEVLGLEKVDRNENFFELGGNSVQLVQFYGRLLPLIGREIPVVEVFNHPSVGLLAELLGRDGSVSPAAEPPAEDRSDRRREGRDRLQQRLELRQIARIDGEDLLS